MHVSAILSVGLLPDYPNDPQSRATPELSDNYPMPVYYAQMSLVTLSAYMLIPIRIITTPYRFILSVLCPMLKHCRPDNPASGHLSLLHRASPGLFGHYPKPGYSRTVRPLYEAGLLPDYPNDPRSRATSGLSGYSPKSGFPSLPRLRKAFL